MNKQSKQNWKEVVKEYIDKMPDAKTIRIRKDYKIEPDRFRNVYGEVVTIDITYKDEYEKV